MKRCSLRLWAVPKDPFSPTCTTFLAEVWNPVTHQAIKLESCSNPLRIQQVLKSNSKKQIFRLGLSFSGGGSQVGVILSYFGHLCLALGAVPMGHFWTQSLVKN